MKCRRLSQTGKNDIFLTCPCAKRLRSARLKTTCNFKPSVKYRNKLCFASLKNWTETNINWSSLFIKHLWKMPALQRKKGSDFVKKNIIEVSLNPEVTWAFPAFLLFKSLQRLFLPVLEIICMLMSGINYNLVGFKWRELDILEIDKVIKVSRVCVDNDCTESSLFLSIFWFFQLMNCTRFIRTSSANVFHLVFHFREYKNPGVRSKFLEIFGFCCLFLLFCGR